MLVGTVSNARNTVIEPILNANNRVSAYYGKSIDEVIENNKIALLRGLPNKYSIFEDSIGNIPVVNDNQAVGLILDKTNKLQRGSELVATGNLSSFTMLGSGSKTNTSITTTGANAGVVYNILTPGKWYEISVNYSSTTTDEFSINTYDQVSATISPIRIDKGKAIFNAEYSRIFLKHGTTGVTSGITITIKELPGRHLIQKDPAKKATVSYRYNVTKSSEDLTDVVWINENINITINQPAPDGTNTAYLVSNTPNEISRLTQVNTAFEDTPGSYLRSVYLKAGSTVNSVIVFEGVGGPDITNYVSFNIKTKEFGLQTNYLEDYGFEELQDNWIRVWLKHTSGTTKIVTNNWYIGHSAGIPNTNEFYIWHPDMRLSMDNVKSIPKYQATYPDGTCAKNHFAPYLKTNSVSNYQTSFTLTNVDAVVVAGGFACINDATKSMFLEYGDDATTINGSFSIEVPDSDNGRGITFRSRGTENKFINHTFMDEFPKRVSFLCMSNISDPLMKLSINNTDKPQLESSLGTGNFSSLTLNLFSKSNNTNFGNYRVYILPIVIFMKNNDPGFDIKEWQSLTQIVKQITQSH